MISCVTKNSYYQILRIRMIEEAIAKRYAEQNMRCPVHLSIGQEAIAVGVSEHLSKHDYVVSNHRAHAHYLAKGGSLKEMIAEIYGKSTGCSLGRGGSMHLVDLEVGFLGSTPIVGGNIPIGVGAAFAAYQIGEERISVIYFGDAATEEGVFLESLNFASLHNLQVLFVCENNFYSVYTHLSERQSKQRNCGKLAEAHGIRAFEGDGNDVESVSTITKEAIASIRRGQGPVFIEFFTYRHKEHCGPNCDLHLNYRTLQDHDAWLAKDPLKVFERRYLFDNATMREEITSEIEEAFNFALSSNFPMYDPQHLGMYATNS